MEYLPWLSCLLFRIQNVEDLHDPYLLHLNCLCLPGFALFSCTNWEVVDTACGRLPFRVCRFTAIILNLDTLEILFIQCRYAFVQCQFFFAQTGKLGLFLFLGVQLALIGAVNHCIKSTLETGVTLFFCHCLKMEAEVYSSHSIHMWMWAWRTIVKFVFV